MTPQLDMEAFNWGATAGLEAILEARQRRDTFADDELAGYLAGAAAGARAQFNPYLRSASIGYEHGIALAAEVLCQRRRDTIQLRHSR